MISTMLLVTGITTILQSYFGTRLPLVQGSSFVYLAPALVIINSQEYRNLTEHVSLLTRINVMFYHPCAHKYLKSNFFFFLNLFKSHT